MSKTAAIITGFISFALATVGLFPLQANAATGTEPAINFVIDVSGSMYGEKLESAVDAIEAVANDTLTAPHWDFEAMPARVTSRL